MKNLNDDWFFGGGGSLELGFSGQFMTAVCENGYIHNSSDYGVSWTEIDSVPYGDWKDIAINYSGQYRVAVKWNDGTSVGYIYVSNDYGVTWVEKTSVGLTRYDNCSISSNGQYMCVSGYQTGLWVSNDYGVTWVKRRNADRWAFNKISANGQYMICCNYINSVFVSSDYGVTWVSRLPLPYSGHTWNGCAMSSSGQYMYAALSGGGPQLYKSIYFSDDYGITWTKSDCINISYADLDCSSDGSIVISGDTFGIYVHLSTDYGHNFTQISVGTNTKKVSIGELGDIILMNSPDYLKKSINQLNTIKVIDTYLSKTWNSVSVNK